MAQAVHRRSQGRIAHTEFLRHLATFAAILIAGEKRFQPLELGAPALTRVFVAQPSQHTVEQGGSPLVRKKGLGREFVIRLAMISLLSESEIERECSILAAAFLSLRAVPLVGQKMSYRNQ